MDRYYFAGIDIAMQILRPGATYEISGLEIIQWNDPRPQPTTQEIIDMVESIKQFEDSNIMNIVNENGDVLEETESQKFMQEYTKKIST